MVLIHNSAVALVLLGAVSAVPTSPATPAEFAASTPAPEPTLPAVLDELDLQNPHLNLRQYVPTSREGGTDVGNITVIATDTSSTEMTSTGTTSASAAAGTSSGGAGVAAVATGALGAGVGVVGMLLL